MTDESDRLRPGIVGRTDSLLRPEALSVVRKGDDVLGCADGDASFLFEPAGEDISGAGSIIADSAIAATG